MVCNFTATESICLCFDDSYTTAPTIISGAIGSRKRKKKPCSVPPSINQNHAKRHGQGGSFQPTNRSWSKPFNSAVQGAGTVVVRVVDCCLSDRVCRHPVPVSGQCTIQSLPSQAVFAAKPEQGPDTVADLLVGREQLGEVTHLVQPLLVIAHSAFHQQARYTVLHLHRLPQHQASVAQGAPPVPDLSRSHVALRQKVAAQKVGNQHERGEEDTGRLPTPPLPKAPRWHSERYKPRLALLPLLSRPDRAHLRDSSALWRHTPGTPRSCYQSSCSPGKGKQILRGNAASSSKSSSHLFGLSG